MKNSSFAFDDREFLTFGEVCVQVVELNEEYISFSRSSRQSGKGTKNSSFGFQKFIAIGASAIMGIVLNGSSLSSNTPLKWPPSLMPGAEVTTRDLEPPILDKKLAAQFKQARGYLGLKQPEVVLMTGIAKSTIEKIEQGIYPSIGSQVREQMTLLIELAELMREQFGEKKYIARSRLNSPDSILGSKTPFEYAKEHGPQGLQAIIGLERKSLG